ncbi:hypothetical protein ACWIUD_03575 [Helicobacter sp. 23-1044]
MRKIHKIHAKNALDSPNLIAKKIPPKSHKRVAESKKPHRISPKNPAESKITSP